MEFIGRDKITQTGEKSRLKIDNSRQKKKWQWHETAIGIVILTVVATVIANVISKTF